MTATSAIPVLTFAASPARAEVGVDLERLVASRLLLQANSGGGKSHALRYLLEQTHGRVQQVVLDPEGEFASLRERFPYVLAAKGGDVPAEPRSAALLCRRLIELGASAVVDLYELKLPDRRRFVRLFLEELMHVPRALWHPVLVVLDEAHNFAPERGSGEAESTEAVIALATQGRKRGFCLVAASQRLSKLHKDVAAELLNKMIGRTGLDVDMRRAGDEIGYDKEQRMALRTLAPGDFYVYGPAITNEVRLVRTGSTETSHPKAGAVGAAPPPPPEKVKKLLAQLTDLPKEAEAEVRSLLDAKKRIAELERAARSNVTRSDPEIVERAVNSARQGWEKQSTRALVAEQRRWVKFEGTMRDAMRRVTDLLARAHTVLLELDEAPTPDSIVPVSDSITVIGDRATRAAAQKREDALVNAHYAKRDARRRAEGNGDAPDGATLSKGERAILSLLAEQGAPVTREHLTVATGYKRSSRDTYLQRLRAAGLVDTQGDGFVLTEDGVAAIAPHAVTLPRGPALLAHYLETLSTGEAETLGIIAEAHPGPVERDVISERTGYQRSSRDTYLQRLRARRLIDTGGRGTVRLSDSLAAEVERR